MRRESDPANRRCKWLAAMTGTALFGLAAAGIIVAPVAGADVPPPPKPVPDLPSRDWYDWAVLCNRGWMDKCSQLGAGMPGAPQQFTDYGRTCGGRAPLGGDPCEMQFSRWQDYLPPPPPVRVAPGSS
jgi:hypothetical protein